MRYYIRIVIAIAGGLLSAWLTYMLVAMIGLIAFDRYLPKFLILGPSLAIALVAAWYVFRWLSSLSRWDTKAAGTVAGAFRKAWAWTIGLSAVQLVLIPFLTYPYWSDAIEGYFLNQ